MTYIQIEPLYVTSFEEVLWGGILVALTMGMHGYGMLVVLRVTHYLKQWLGAKLDFMSGLLPVISASCLIMIVHLAEVMVWASFFLWKGNFPNRSMSFYFALNEYTTVGSKFSLPVNWRLLEGMIATAGLLTFAWSTGVLFSLAKEFQDQWLESFKQRHKKGPSVLKPSPKHESDKR
jgi:voltage-gated potassium channel